MKEFVYFSPLYGGCIGILTIWPDGFLVFAIDGREGPCDGMPETWAGKWKRIGKL